MIIKPADNHADELAQLEQWGQSADTTIAKAARIEQRSRNAGIRGEAESAYLIDFDFGKTHNWAVIHDLRLEHGGRVAQIDHLLLGRTLECYVLETKHFHAGVKITDDGEFLRWNTFEHSYEGMPSPLEQNSRHITVLRDMMGVLPLPTRLGFRLSLEFHSLVLASKSARIDRPKTFDTSAVIKADQLKTRIMGEIDSESTLTIMRKTAKMVSSDTLKEVATMLARQHRPTHWPLPPTLKDARKNAYATAAVATSSRPACIAEPAITAAPCSTQAAASPPSCKQCHSHKGSIQYGKYGYYFCCAPCGANTAIRFACMAGHHPKLRKAKLQFFRDCPECGSSDLYFTNPTEMNEALVPRHT